MSVDWNAIRSAAYTWAQSTGLVAIWADQAGPKPARPYVTLKIAPVSTGAFYETRQDLLVDGKFDHGVVKEMTISVQIVASVTMAGLSQHTFEADKLVDSLQLIAIQAAFQAVPISIIDTSPIIDTTDYLDTAFEPKAVFDVRFYAVSNTSEIVPTIAGTSISSVEILGNVDGILSTTLVGPVP